MVKVTDAQERAIKDALANGKPLPDGVSINFGDPEPFQKGDTTEQPKPEKQG